VGRRVLWTMLATAQHGTAVVGEDSLCAPHGSKVRRSASSSLYSEAQATAAAGRGRAWRMHRLSDKPRERAPKLWGRRNGRQLSEGFSSHRRADSRPRVLNAARRTDRRRRWRPHALRHQR
jgi:hypothetical protein